MYWNLLTRFFTNIRNETAAITCSAAWAIAMGMGIRILPSFFLVARLLVSPERILFLALSRRCGVITESVRSVRLTGKVSSFKTLKSCLWFGLHCTAWVCLPSFQCESSWNVSERHVCTTRQPSRFIIVLLFIVGFRRTRNRDRTSLLFFLVIDHLPPSPFRPIFDFLLNFRLLDDVATGILSWEEVIPLCCGFELV